MIDKYDAIALWQRLRKAARRGTGAKLEAEEVEYLAWLEGALINANLDPPVEGEEKSR